MFSVKSCNISVLTVMSFQFIEGGHKTGRIARHKGCWKDTFFIYLEEEEMKQTLGMQISKYVWKSTCFTCKFGYI